MTQSIPERFAPPDFEALRTRFPIFRTRTYINSCSYGALSLDVQEALGAYMQSRLELGSDWGGWVGKAEAVRALLADLVNGAPDEMAVTSSVSECVNNLASAFDFTAGRNEVVLTDFDFPTTSQIWLSRTRSGAVVRRAKADETGAAISLAEFDRLISDRTLLVSIPLVCYRNGAMLDVKPIIDLAHSRGAKVLLDAYQAIGSMPIDVRALGVDFLVAGTLKYLIGGAGVANYANAFAVMSREGALVATIGGTVESKVYPGMDHGDTVVALAHPWRSRRDVMPHILRFIDQHRPDNQPSSLAVQAKSR